jgi:hypothetical protein
MGNFLLQPQKARETAMPERLSFASFWPQYLSAHRDPRTRATHYLGTTLGVALLLIGVIVMDWRLILAAPVVGYGLAMPSHPLFEHNLPKTFEHPLLSFAADFYMLYLWATGRLAGELARLPSATGEAELR